MLRPLVLVTSSHGPQTMTAVVLGQKTGESEGRIVQRHAPTLSSTHRRWMNDRMLKCVLLLLICATTASATEGSFRLPENDLPSAIIAGHEIAFTRNGAFVVTKDGRALCDGGLLYHASNWTEWGTQIRRSAPTDGWTLDPANPKALLHTGTLFDINYTKRFAFKQRTEIIPGGIRLTYEVTPPEKRVVQGLGFVLHIPIAETRQAVVLPWPSFRHAPLPERGRGGALLTSRARACVLTAGGAPRLSVIGRDGTAWMVLDDRQWGNNTYRIIATAPALPAGIARGEPVSFSLDLLLGDVAQAGFTVGAVACETDRYGRMAFRKAGAKIMEGGIGIGTSVPVWAFTNSTDPSSPAGTSAGEHVVAYDVAMGKDRVTCESGVTNEGDGLVAAYRIKNLPPRARPADVCVAFAVPIPLLTTGPFTEVELARQEATVASAKSVNEKESVPLFFQDGTVLLLRAESPWSTVSTVVDGQRVLVFKTPFGTPTGETRSARIEIVPVATTRGGTR